MSILQLLMIAIVLPGMFRVYSAISGFLAKNSRTAPHAKKAAFVIVVVSAALFSTPLLTLGLPSIVRTIAFGLYGLYVVVGALYVWDGIQAVARRISGPRQ
jgi:hypothetical protein